MLLKDFFPKAPLLKCALGLSPIIDCEIPTPYSNGSTGNNFSVFMTSSFRDNIVVNSSAAYIIALTQGDLVIGSAYISEDSLLNGQQSLAIWGDDNFTEVIDGASDGEIIILKIVDGSNLYAIPKSINIKSLLSPNK